MNQSSISLNSGRLLLKNMLRYIAGHKLASTLLMSLALPMTCSNAADSNITAAPSWQPDGVPTTSTPSGLPVIPTMATPQAQLVNSTISVANMGQERGLRLSGGQLESGVLFTLPSDQVITNAKFSMAVKASPALEASNSILQVILNGQELGRFSLTPGAGSFDGDIPAAAVVSSNNLSFKVLTEQPLNCEKGQSNKYWVTILPTSTVQLEGQQLNLGQNMSNFPRPFFDNMQMQESKVPMVFSDALQPQDVSAAAMVASYFGMTSNYRGVDFPVVLNDLPESNAILFGRPGDKIGSLTLPDSKGPMLKIIDNPANPLYKLLLVVGHNESELRQAAYRLVSGDLPVNSQQLDVATQSIPTRHPYDAPRWIDTQKPVTLGELAQKANNSLTSTGIFHDAVHVAFRAAPDLFMWDGRSIPVTIKYRFPTETWIDEDESQLNVSLNGTFLHNLTVNKVGLLENLWHKLGGDTRQEQYTMALAPYLIYGDNQMEFYFDIKPKQSAPCSVLSSDNIKSRIDPSSTIDLAGTYHFTQLPNLAYFVGATYPFTRMADFTDTLLLLSDKPSANEIHTLLNMAARAGNATGVVVSNAKVAFGLKGNEQDNPLFDRDILAVTTLSDSSFNHQLLEGSLFSNNGNNLSVIQPTQVQRLLSWLTGDWYHQPVDADRYLSSTADWRGFLSYRSRWSNDHVVVVAAATTSDQLLKVQSDLKSAKINAAIGGDLAIITDDGGIRSFSVGKQFPTGQMPWYMMVVWYANQHGVLLSLLTLIISLLVGSSLYVLLVRHAAKRLGKQLKKNQDDEKS
jgi:hypothetical protein